MGRSTTAGDRSTGHVRCASQTRPQRGWVQFDDIWIPSAVRTAPLIGQAAAALAPACSRRGGSELCRLGRSSDATCHGGSHQGDIWEGGKHSDMDERGRQQGCAASAHRRLQEKGFLHCFWHIETACAKSSSSDSAHDHS
eukprot:6198216-Pleurochrysis_carterae.AAC.1